MTAREAEQTLAIVRTLISRVHLATPGQLPEVVLEAGRTLGWTVLMYLTDVEQRLLVPAPVTGVEARPPQQIETTLAGRCFRSVEPVFSTTGDPLLWLPLVDGAHRLGVLEVRLPAGADPAEGLFLERCRLLADLTGHLVAAKRPYGDALDQVMRLRPRSVASELLHQLLPPLTAACEGFVVSGLLQPAYDVAADAFDYSVVNDIAHLAVFDATGHDLDGTLLAAVALTAYRNSRREGHGLFDTARIVDELVAAHGGGERFATGILAELHLPTGRLRYLNAGHPAPLMMREGKVVKQLDQGRRILFGLGDGQAGIAEEWLQPGDRIVFYTDGITEARDREGTFFGVDRLVDRLAWAAASGQPAPETLRRISHDVLDHQGGTLQDDATLLIAEWSSGGEQKLTSSRSGSVAPEDLSPSPGAGTDLPRR
jgi:sigma-B regulation protein RsbU (phosphoserine phosphatase)